MAYIYGLVDPITNELRYVGYTAESNIETRCGGHWKERNHKKRSYKRNWLKGLCENHDIKPKMVAIEEVTQEEWVEAEIFWIDYCRSIGCNLTNVALGGMGSIKGTKLTEEHKVKIKASYTGKKYPNKKSPEGGVWNKNISGYTFKQGGKVANGVKREWQDGEERSVKRRQAYICTDPNGKIYNINGMGKFCRVHNLQASNMCQVANGKLNSHKGWKVVNG